MAKQSKPVKEIESVSLKDKDMVIDLPRIGMLINSENLTIERYQKLVGISHHYEQFFKVTYKSKKDEQSKVEA